MLGHKKASFSLWSHLLARNLHLFDTVSRPHYQLNVLARPLSGSCIISPPRDRNAAQLNAPLAIRRRVRLHADCDASSESRIANRDTMYVAMYRTRTCCKSNFECVQRQSTYMAKTGGLGDLIKWGWAKISSLLEHHSSWTQLNLKATNLSNLSVDKYLVPLIVIEAESRRLDSRFHWTGAQFDNQIYGPLLQRQADIVFQTVARKEQKATWLARLEVQRHLVGSGHERLDWATRSVVRKELLAPECGLRKMLLCKNDTMSESSCYRICKSAFYMYIARCIYIYIFYCHFIVNSKYRPVMAYRPVTAWYLNRTEKVIKTLKDKEHLDGML